MTIATGRRTFLKYLGAGFGGSLAASGLGPLAHARRPMPFQHRATPENFLSFSPLKPTTRDDLILPEGFRYDLIAAWGDKITESGERFGYNADYTAFLPRNADGTEGLLFVNHEYVNLATATEVGVYEQTFPILRGSRCNRLGWPLTGDCLPLPPANARLTEDGSHSVRPDLRALSVRRG